MHAAFLSHFKQQLKTKKHNTSALVSMIGTTDSKDRNAREKRGRQKPVQTQISDLKISDRR